MLGVADDRRTSMDLRLSWCFRVLNLDIWQKECVGTWVGSA